MRLLYITPAFPYPLTTGYLRHYFLIRELSRSHTVTLLSLVGSGFRDEDREAMMPFVERVITFPVAAGTRGGSLLVKGVRALTVGNAPARALGRTALGLLAGQHYDGVIFTGKRTLAALPHLKRLPVVIDMCDAASTRIRGSLQHTHLPALPAQAVRYAKMRWTEAAMAARGDHLVFATCRDLEALYGTECGRASVVPQGVDAAYWTRRSSRLGRRTLVFGGAMNYPPNEDAALVLTEQITPRLRARFPDLEVLLVGRDPEERLLRAARCHGVTVTGFVDDVRPYLERASLFVAPMRFGMGVQNKLLEALAMQIPVITTPLAADGLRTEDGNRAPVELASGADEFVERVARHLAQDDGEGQPYVAGRRYVEANFVWPRSVQKLEVALAAAASAHRN